MGSRVAQETQKEQLDRAYLRRWAKDLQVDDTLARILAEAEKVG